MYEVICLPTDGSEGAAEALEHALAAARAHDADLHLLSVVDKRVHMAAGDDEKEAVLAELHADAEDAVGALADVAREAGLEPTAVVREGVPFREILAYADEVGVDLVVMGTHGRTGREKRLNLGSTTERVVKAGEGPVLVVDIG